MKPSTAADDLATLTALRRAAGVEPDDLTAGGVRIAKALSRMRGAAALRSIGLSDDECPALLRLCEKAHVDPLALTMPGAVRTLAISQLRMHQAREDAGVAPYRPAGERGATAYDADGMPDTYGLAKLEAQREERGSTADGTLDPWDLAGLARDRSSKR